MGGDTEYGAREYSAFSRNLEAGPGTTIGRMGRDGGIGRALGIRHNGLMDADVVVIGAGALGLSTALHCAMAGRRAVVERHTAGSQASGRAAGLFKSVQADELRTRLARRSIAKAVTFADCRPRAALPGLWVASGCNGSGFSSSLAIGEALATWITSGAPHRA